MGACLSSPVAQEEVPTCKVCGHQASAAWAQLNITERAAWTRDGSTVCCRKCLLEAKIARIKFVKEREAYKEAAAAMYPKPSASYREQRSTLRRVNSGELWQGSRSFKSRYEPPQALKELLSSIERAQQEDPSQFVGKQRRPAGFIPSSAPGALSNPYPQQQQQRHIDASAAAAAITAQVQQRMLGGTAGVERQLSGILEDEQSTTGSSPTSCGSARSSMRSSLSRRASAHAAWAVAEVAREAAQQEQRELAAAAAVAVVTTTTTTSLEVQEQRGPRQQQEDQEGGPAAEPDEWQRRRMLWQLHHSRSKLLASGSGALDLDALEADSDDGQPALGDSAYSLEGIRPSRGSKAEEGAEAAEAAALPPAAQVRGVRCC